MSNDQTYRPVRALVRGIAVLRELNRMGCATPAEIARATGIDRTTTYRLLATLDSLGFVRTGPVGDEFVLTEAVRGLSEGYTSRDKTTQIVAHHLRALWQKVVWPTDFATFEQGAMIIRETTHPFSPYSIHRAMVGQPKPLLTSALGRAALAGSSPQHRATMLEMTYSQNITQSETREIENRVDRIVTEYEQLGYAWSNGVRSGRVSAIAVSVSLKNGEAAALNLVFFKSAMSIGTAAERFLEALKLCASKIEEELSDQT